MIVIVDSREFKSKVVKELFRNNIEVQSMNLMIGDYLIGEKIIVERKSVKDFVDSLIDKRIFRQLQKMKEHYKTPVLIIEGVEDLYSVRKVHANAIRGLLASIAVDYQIPIISSRDETDTCQLIISLCKRTKVLPKPFIKKVKSVVSEEVQENMISMIPGVGIVGARELLKSFKTIKKISNASADELSSAKRIGGKVGKKIYEIFNKEYKRQ